MGVWLEENLFSCSGNLTCNRQPFKLAKCETSCLAGLNAILSDCRRVKAVKINLAQKTLKKYLYYA